MNDDPISRIEAALAAGPTPGPWELILDNEDNGDGTFSITKLASIGGCGCCGSPWIKKPDAIYIAACSPDRIERVLAEIERLRAELETERMRLAACGVVALANTPESASKAREMRPEYRSASLDDVEHAVDEQMRLRAELAEANAELSEQARLLGISGSVEARLLARVAELEREVAEAKRDADRYRWLRAQQWDTSPLAVVVDPKRAVKLGHDLPSLDRLDAAIDDAIDDQHIKCLKCGVELSRCSGYTCGCEYPVTISHIELSDDERGSECERWRAFGAHV